MSSESDNLESLTNDELHRRMLELGLPKMPVTDTTRKVLIKRIRNHVSEAKAKTRRETIAVVKYSSDEEVASEPEVAKAKPKAKVEVNRRATLAPSIVPRKEEKVPQPISKPQRRSGRITPTSSVEVPPPTRVAVPPAVYEIIEDSDEEAEEILTQRPPRRSKSKSPSLSRSDVVTTSYKQVIESVKESPEEEESEAMEVDEPPEDPRPYTQLHYRPPSASKFSSDLERRTLGSYSTLRSSTSTYSPYDGRYSTLSSPYASKLRETEPQEEFEAPYLSEFTRRLSQLKHQKLDSGSSLYRTDSLTVPSAKADNSISASIVAVFNALDRKFNLKRNLLIFAAILLVIFLFVLFLY
ncbi:otefin [Phlebotomus papatasi]|uniref:Uncharacterized protein n=1 Tax=Phlebotomus papatasi TaxID=29031 RepID=A0A1B0EX19_PHLPP|nr:otefin [Phlebotomus papatasi]